MALQAPVRTHSLGSPGPEIRAYKLGKRRWSYNQVELILQGEHEESRWDAPAKLAAHLRQGARVLQAVSHAAEFADAHQDSAVAFLLHLESGHTLQAHVYLCYDEAPPDAGATGAGAAGRALGPAPVPGTDLYAWHPVTRQHCCKGCEGRVLRSIQRFGRVGKRSSAGADADQPSPSPGPAAGMKKDPRFLYLSLDEACTHVGAASFRLVAGIYDATGARLLATALSPPIRVLANNDVPTGAARIVMEARLPADWEQAAGQVAAAVHPPPARLPTLRGCSPFGTSPRRKAASPKARSTAGAAGAAAMSEAASCEIASDPAELAFGLGTPEIGDGLPTAHSAPFGRSPSARQRKRRAAVAAAPPCQQQQGAARRQGQQGGPAVQVEQQQGPGDLRPECHGSYTDCGAQPEPWLLPLYELASPGRCTSTPRHQLPLCSLPAPALPGAAFTSDCSPCGQYSCDGYAGATGTAESSGSGRPLRRRLSMSAGTEQDRHDAEGPRMPPDLSSAVHLPMLVPQEVPHWLAPRPAGASCAPAGGAAVPCQEADRQLRLLHQLKSHILASSNDAASSASPPPQVHAPAHPDAAGWSLLPSPCPSASAAMMPGYPSDSLLCPLPSDPDSLLAEESGLALDGLGLSLLEPACGEGSSLHLALMDASPGVDLLNFGSLFDDADDSLIRS